MKELELMVQAGLTPVDAIRAATSVGVRRLGDNGIGAVAVGCKADLLLIEADPLQDVSAIRNNLKWVMKDGRIAGR